MREYTVSALVEIHGFCRVQATSPEEAAQKAKDETSLYDWEWMSPPKFDTDDADVRDDGEVK